MKKIINYNKFSLIILLVVILIAVLITIDYNNQYKQRLFYSESIIEAYPELEDIDFTYKEDTYTVFLTLLNENKVMLYVQLLFPILIIIPLIINMKEIMKSIEYKKLDSSLKYQKYMMKNIIKNYFGIFIIPLFLICLFICSYIYSKHFNIDYNVFNIRLLEINPILFIIIYILNLLGVSIFYLNIASICVKYIKESTIAIIGSFLLSFLLVLLMQLIGYFIDSIFNINIYNSIFNIFNLWTYGSSVSVLSVTIYILILVIISTLALNFVYKNNYRKKGG